MRLAILGPGNIADHFLAPALRHSQGATLWSVLSRDLGRAQDFAARHGAVSAVPAYTDLDALLADDKLDGVIIASPDGVHAAQTIAAARAGKHVLVEKPMATNLDDARAMVKACADARVTLALAYHLRWHTGHRLVAARVHAGELGEVRHMRVSWTYKSTDDSNWRAHDAVARWWGLAGVGTHCLDLVRWFLTPVCGEVTDVASLVTRTVYGGPNDETALVMLRFASGATAEIVTSVLFESSPRVEVYGSKGTIECKGTLGPHGAGRVRVHGQDLAYARKDPYEGEINDFVKAVAQGRVPEVGGDEGLRNVELLLRADPR